MSTVITKDEGRRSLPLDEERLLKYIDDISQDFQGLPVKDFKERILDAVRAKEEYSAGQITNLLVLEQLSQISLLEPDWTFTAARTFARRLYKEASKNRSYDASERYGDFFGLVKTLASKGLYDGTLLADYSDDEIKYLGSIIKPEQDDLFTYIGIRSLADRYLTTDYDMTSVYELPQERFMIIAMHLMRNEDKANRLKYIEEYYFSESELFHTVATPTLSNSGRTHGQLSSCFIDTIEDSLDGIFLGNWDVARLSKDGGGIGVYMGKVRALGSDIKDFKGVASGVVPWIKQLNNTAVAVDQLGQRKGAIAVYLDGWHKDIQAFLDLRLNNGDERRRAHDIFTGVCLPDLFMEQVRSRGNWYLFDPHEVRKLMGWSLEDFYDEKKGSGTFRKRYQECIDHPLLSRTRIQAIDLMKSIMKSQLSTGTPFMFYRDEVNRANPNKKFREDGTGITVIYCSNLCTEITQNQSPTTIHEEYIVEENGESYSITKRKLGDFVVCNLASVSLGRAVPAGMMGIIIKSIVRGLDNVIDLNTIAVHQAQVTNRKFRAIGLGSYGWHHLLALEGIRWESDEAVKRADELYEDFAYYAILASHELAIEKGHYPAFPGSEWDTGEYFVRRGYVERNEFGAIIPIPGQERWYDLCLGVMQHGVRNGWIMAVAPNASTAKIGRSTDGIDPIYRISYSEEKKDYKIPVIAPDLDMRTMQYYRKTAFMLDQHWSIKQNAARQRHIDQSISFNLYVPSDIKASALLALHMDAWESGLKTTYYVRSTANSEIEDECESCQ